MMVCFRECIRPSQVFQNPFEEIDAALAAEDAEARVCGKLTLPQSLAHAPTPPLKRTR